MLTSIQRRMLKAITDFRHHSRAELTDRDHFWRSATQFDTTTEELRRAGYLTISVVDGSDHVLLTDTGHTALQRFDLIGRRRAAIWDYTRAVDGAANLLRIEETQPAGTLTGHQKLAHDRILKAWTELEEAFAIELPTTESNTA